MCAAPRQYVRLYSREPQDDKLDDGPWLLKKIEMHLDSTDEECAVIREWLSRMQEDLSERIVERGPHEAPTGRGERLLERQFDV